MEKNFMLYIVIIVLNKIYNNLFQNTYIIKFRTISYDI